MWFLKALGRFVLASSVGILVLSSGVFGASVLSLLALPTSTNPNRAPGDGFLVLEFLAIGVVLCVPLSIAAACWVLFRKGAILKTASFPVGGVSL